jgi:hypothetical protein
MVSPELQVVADGAAEQKGFLEHHSSSSFTSHGTCSWIIAVNAHSSSSDHNRGGYSHVNAFGGFPLATGGTRFMHGSPVEKPEVRRSGRFSR